MVLCPLNMKYSTPCKEECALFYNGGCLIAQVLKEKIIDHYNNIKKEVNYYNNTQLNIDEIADKCIFSYKFDTKEQK